MTGVDVMRALPRLVLGASRLDRIPLDDAFRVLDAAIELGLTAIDSAVVYGQGRVDAVLGAWLRSRGVRDQVLLLGKGGHPDAHGARVRPDALAADLAITLERLGTDRLDGYLLHRDDPAVPVDEIVDALDVHVQAGRARAIGASNWSVARIRAALAASDARGRARFALSSPQLSLAAPSAPPWPGCVTLSGSAQQADRAFYAASGLPVLAWSALAAGFLLHRPETLGGVYDDADNRARRDRLDAHARARGCTATQLALAYVLSAPFPVSAVIRCATRAHLEECRGAIELALSSDERTYLEGAWL